MKHCLKGILQKQSKKEYLSSYRSGVLLVSKTILKCMQETTSLSVKGVLFPPTSPLRDTLSTVLQLILSKDALMIQLFGLCVRVGGALII